MANISNTDGNRVKGITNCRTKRGQLQVTQTEIELKLEQIVGQNVANIKHRRK